MNECMVCTFTASIHSFRVAYRNSDLHPNAHVQAPLSIRHPCCVWSNSQAFIFGIRSIYMCMCVYMNKKKILNLKYNQTKKKFSYLFRKRTAYIYNDFIFVCAHETAFLVDFIFIETFQLQTYALISPDFFFLLLKSGWLLYAVRLYMCAVLTRNVNAICPQNVSKSEKVAAIIFFYI